MNTSGKYSEADIQRLRELDIRLFVQGASPTGRQKDIECPFCGKKKFSYNGKVKNHYFKCWACEKGFFSPFDAVAFYMGVDVKTHFLEVVEETARQGGVHLLPQEQRRAQSVKAASVSNKSSFCRRQLEGSGLTEEDVMAHVLDGNDDLYVSPFRKGRLNDYYGIDDKGDDMLIYYYDLYGRPMTYKSKGSSRERQYVRVRWSNPEIHLSADGTEMKYQTPPGATCRVYIPEKIRKMFRNKSHIDTLFLQEGEKKAEKACKHGMLSIGIQGINNFGSKDEGPIQDILDLARVCTVSNIVLVMDSDWNELSRNITIGARADSRPNIFSKAVIKFRQYMKALYNQGLSVDIWWGHVNTNEHGDKGVDDLLCGSLLGREDELMSDIIYTMNSHNGKGVWLDIHKITSVSDEQIRDFWSLNDANAFYELHKARLAEISSFKIGRIRYRVEDDKLIQASRYASDSDIYKIVTNSKGEDKVEFNDVEAFRFLAASGFSRLRNNDDAASGFELIREDDGIIDRVAPYEVRDYIREYVNSTCKSEIVLLYFAKKLSTIMADKQFENLAIISDDFNHFAPGIQRTPYNNGMVEITATSITPECPMTRVWRSSIVPRKFRRVEIIKDIQQDENGDFYLTLTPEADKCEFFQFICNTSNNIYDWDAPRDITREEVLEWHHHVVNKLTTIGYLLCDYKYASERKAVIIQDHLMSEVGQSHGGAGKSIVGNAIKHIRPQYFIDGKQMQANDEFLLSGVNKTTRNIFIDDVKTNFDFVSLFAMITGDMNVNPKGKDRYSIPVEESPKILITTNHAINHATENASKRRISYMEFSTWYNPEHTIADDFDHMFFDDWDDEQWNLFDNFMAECVMYYLRSFEECWARKGQGAVPPPMRNIELRTLRQEMSESLYQWAEEYFDPSGDKLNARLRRSDVLQSFFEYAGTQGHGVTRTNFRKKIEAYCKFKGYDLNINKPITEHGNRVTYNDWKPINPDKSYIGEADKSGGIEYFTIYSPTKGEDVIADTKPF